MRANRQNISDNMDMVEKKMFDRKGDLKNPRNLVTPDNYFPNQIPGDAIPDAGARVVRMHKA